MKKKIVIDTSRSIVKNLQEGMLYFEPYNAKKAQKAAKELLAIMNSQPLVKKRRRRNYKKDYLKHVKEKYT
jgi:hypothetical protein